MARFDLLSPFPPEECVFRLQGAITPANEVDIRTAYRWVQLAEKPYVRDSLKTFLRATLTEHESGSRLRGTLGFSPFVNCYFAAALGFLVFAGVMTAVRGVGFPEALVPFAAAVAGVVGVWFIRFISRGQDRRLMAFVTTTLEAKPPGSRRPDPLATSP